MFDNFVFSLKVLQPLMATAGGMWPLLTSCYIFSKKWTKTNEEHIGSVVEGRVEESLFPVLQETLWCVLEQDN